jgi:hypothetical protein
LLSAWDLSWSAAEGLTLERDASLGPAPELDLTRSRLREDRIRERSQHGALGWQVVDVAKGRGLRRVSKGYSRWSGLKPR